MDLPGHLVKTLFRVTICIGMLIAFGTVNISEFDTTADADMLKPVLRRHNGSDITVLTSRHLLESLKKSMRRIDVMRAEWINEFDMYRGKANRALKHMTSTLPLERAVFNALTRNVTIHIGVAGGSISACRYGYGYLIRDFMQDILSVPVIVNNAAIGATDSRYYANCMGAHMDIGKLDLVLWEFAANDFIKSIGPWAQEEFTRMILNLENQPQLVYVNFWHGAMMRQVGRSCINNERIASVPLSNYYDVPSISMPDAVCPIVTKGDYMQFLNEDKAHPNPKNHKLMTAFLVEILHTALRNILDKVESGVWTHTMNVYEQFGDNFKLPKPLFNKTQLFLPKCWSALATKKNPKMTLIPIEVHGWEAEVGVGIDPKRTDLKQFWESKRENASITFRVDIAPYLDLNCTVAIVASSAGHCGKVRAYFDDDDEEEHSTIVDGRYNYKITKTERISTDLKPGNHTLTLVALSENPFRLAAIATSYNINQKTWTMLKD